MQNLTQADLQGILEFLKKLYSSYSFEQISTLIISLLPVLISADAVCQSTLDFEKRSYQAISSISSAPYPEDLETVIFHNPAENPLIANYLKTGDSRAYKISDFLNQNQLHRLEGVYQSFLRPIGMEDQMGIVLQDNTPVNRNGFSQIKSVTAISAVREQNFSERDRVVLNLLHPHLLNAFQNVSVLTQMQQELIQLNQTIDQLGAVILNLDGQAQLMTHRAFQWLTQYFQPPSHQSRLPEDLQHWVQYQISLMTQSSELPPASLPLRLERDGKQLMIRVVCDPLNNQYLLLMQEQRIQSLSVELLELLGLTRREAEVLLWVAQDKSNAEIGSLLICSDATVKKHLEHIYQKLGVQTRMSAVMAAFRKLGMLS